MTFAAPLVGPGLLISALLLSGGGESSPSAITLTAATTSSTFPSVTAHLANVTDSSRAEGRSSIRHAASPQGPHACLPNALSASLGQTTNDPNQPHTDVIWTNTSTSPCTMTGFGNVVLTGPTNPMGSTYELPVSAQKASTINLAPRGTAHTRLVWLRSAPDEANPWTPTALLITPPGGTNAIRLNWPGTAVARQDGATHPGTYFDPVAPGSQNVGAP
jgi:uncharacterized protein DUF4232